MIRHSPKPKTPRETTIPKSFAFDPQPDITASELAACLKLLLPNATVLVDKADIAGKHAQAMRHFKESGINEPPFPQDSPGSPMNLVPVIEPDFNAEAAEDNGSMAPKAKASKGKTKTNA